MGSKLIQEDIRKILSILENLVENYNLSTLLNKTFLPSKGNFFHYFQRIPTSNHK